MDVGVGRGLSGIEHVEEEGEMTEGRGCRVGRGWKGRGEERSFLGLRLGRGTVYILVLSMEPTTTNKARAQFLHSLSIADGHTDGYSRRLSDLHNPCQLHTLVNNSCQLHPLLNS